MTDETSPVVTPYPRRTERKRQTRERIICAAQDLFRQLGYSKTTMADISDAADIHVTTLFTHFKTKKDLAAAIADDYMSALVDRVAASKGKMPFFEFFRQISVEWASAFQSRSPQERITYGNELRAEPDPELAFASQVHHKRQVMLFAEYIAHDYGMDLATDPRPVLVAAMLTTGNIIAHDRWLQTNGESDMVADALNALKAGESLIRASLEDVLAQRASEPLVA